MTIATRLLTPAFLLAAVAAPLHAQASPPGAVQGQSQAQSQTAPEETRTIYLRNASLQNDGNDVLTALRNLLPPNVRIYYVFSQQAIVMRGTPDVFALAEKLLADLDRPHEQYRILYTVTESDSGKRIGVQHFTMLLLSYQRATLKQGSRVPVATASRGAGHTDAQNDVTYLDVGLNVDATFNGTEAGGTLRSKLELSSLAEEKSGLGEPDPIVRQTVLEGTFAFVLGKPLVLGSLDIPGSTRHFDVEAVITAVK